MNKILSVFLIGFLTLSINCGGGSDSSSNTDDNQADGSQSAATSTSQAGQLTSSIFSSFLQLFNFSNNQSALTRNLVQNCQTGGSIEITENSLVFDNCDNSQQGFEYLADGSLTLESNNNIQTVTYDLSTTINGITNILTGILSLDTVEEIFSIDIEGSANGVEFATSGELDFNLNNQTVTGDMNYLIDGTNITCSFNNFDITTQDSTLFAEQCSAN